MLVGCLHFSIESIIVQVLRFKFIHNLMFLNNEQSKRNYLIPFTLFYSTYPRLLTLLKT